MDGSSFAEAWNFGPNDNDSRSVSCVVNELSKYWDEPEILEEKGSQPLSSVFEIRYFKNSKSSWMESAIRF